MRVPGPPSGRIIASNDLSQHSPEDGSWDTSDPEAIADLAVLSRPQQTTDTQVKSLFWLKCIVHLL